MGTAIQKKDLALVEVGTGRTTSRAISPVGYRRELAYEHLLAHARNPDAHERWCTIGCFARTLYTRNSAAHRTAARRNVARLRDWLLGQRMILLVSYDGNATGKIAALKLYDPQPTETERQHAEFQLQRMERHSEISAEKAQLWRQLLAAPVDTGQGT